MLDRALRLEALHPRAVASLLWAGIPKVGETGNVSQLWERVILMFVRFWPLSIFLWVPFTVTIALLRENLDLGCSNQQLTLLTAAFLWGQGAHCPRVLFHVSLTGALQSVCIPPFHR